MNGNKENKYKCTCGKAFSYRQGLHGHRKKCIQTQTNINQPEQVIQVLQQELNKKDQELNKKDEELNKKRPRTENNERRNGRTKKESRIPL